MKKTYSSGVWFSRIHLLVGHTCTGCLCPWLFSIHNLSSWKLVGQNKTCFFLFWKKKSLLLKTKWLYTISIFFSLFLFLFISFSTLFYSFIQWTHEVLKRGLFFESEPCLSNILKKLVLVMLSLLDTNRGRAYWRISYEQPLAFHPKKSQWVWDDQSCSTTKAVMNTKIKMMSKIHKMKLMIQALSMMNPSF